MKSKILIIIICIFSIQAAAQIGVNLQMENGYATNIFTNYRRLPDYFSYLSAFLNYDFSNDKQGLRGFYQGNAGLFDTYNTRNYLIHSAGLEYYRYFGPKGDKLNAGISGTLRRHEPDYKWYEYKQGYLYFSFKKVLYSSFYAYLGANLKLREYEYLAPYSFWQNVLYLRISRFFGTGTTLIGETDFLQKQYLNDRPVENFPGLLTEGNGHNRQWIGLLRAAQSLTPTTGLSAQFSIRRSLESSVRYLIDEAGYYYSDEELFDDVFGYESERIETTLKQRLPGSITLSIGGTLLYKHYSNRLALDLDGYPFIDNRLRDDSRLIGQISLSKSWRYSKTFKPVVLTAEYMYLDNRSNDPYYRFNTNYFTVGISQAY